MILSKHALFVPFYFIFKIEIHNKIKSAYIEVLHDKKVGDENVVEIEKFFPADIRAAWHISEICVDDLQELRIRVNRPIQCCYKNSNVMKFPSPSSTEINDVLRYLCKDSLYAFERERKAGYITVKGGHRIGFTGDMFCYDHGDKIIQNVTSMNIRIAHEHTGIAEQVIEYCKDCNHFLNTLLISSPGVGKTSLLRDLIRYCANICKVGVVDERGELAGIYMGNPTLDCGLQSDVISGCTKSQGIEILLRSMSPQIIAIDEIGNEADMKAIMEAAVSGCVVFATIHGRNLADIQRKDQLRQIMLTRFFQRYIVLDCNENGERIAAIYDETGGMLCSGSYLLAS